MMAFTGDHSNPISLDEKTTINELGDRCSNWQRWKNYGHGSQIYLKVCERASGGSGYTQWKNTDRRDVRISWRFNYYKGNPSKGSTRIKGYGQTTPSSCYRCARRNSGLKTWEMTKIAFEGQKGFW